MGRRMQKTTTTLWLFSRHSKRQTNHQPKNATDLALKVPTETTDQSVTVIVINALEAEAGKDGEGVPVNVITTEIAAAGEVAAESGKLVADEAVPIDVITTETIETTVITIEAVVEAHQVPIQSITQREPSRNFQRTPQWAPSLTAK